MSSDYAPRALGPANSGKTWKMLTEARDGDVVVLSAFIEKEHARRILASQGRKRDAVHLVSLDEFDPPTRLIGLAHDRRVYVDHRADELAARDPGARRDLEHIERFALDRFGGTHRYPVSE